MDSDELTCPSAANYSKVSLPVLTVDAHATVIEAALKGYDKWRTSRNRTPDEVRPTPRVRPAADSNAPAQKQQAEAVEKYFEKWCGQLLEMKFEVSLTSPPF